MLSLSVQILVVTSAGWSFLPLLHLAILMFLPTVQMKDGMHIQVKKYSQNFVLKIQCCLPALWSEELVNPTFTGQFQL